jgi:hypothetical protein
MAKNQYRYGREKEKKVAQLLRNKGASVRTSPASKGAADLTVRFPTGTRWRVQVKSARSSKAASPSRKDLDRLKQSSTKTGTTAVVAKVTPWGVEYRSARSGRKLTPPPKRKK